MLVTAKVALLLTMRLHCLIKIQFDSQISYGNLNFGTFSFFSRGLLPVLGFCILREIFIKLNTFFHVF